MSTHNRKSFRRILSVVLRCICFIILAAGLILVTAAIYIQETGGRKSAEVLKTLEERGIVPALHAGTENENGRQDVSQSTVNVSDENHEYEDYELNPGLTMPVEMIDGISYIGILTFPEENTILPVAEEWSYDTLWAAPCRYKGSVYTDDLIICGHNHWKHFSVIKTMSAGESVIFTDLDGNVFQYEIAYTEIIDQDDVPGMENGNWDLTLFTCTAARTSRVAVRCRRLYRDKTNKIGMLQ